MPEETNVTRRDFISSAVRGAGLLAAGGVVGAVAAQSHGTTVWQIDPLKCTQCGKCATDCVLNPSAVRCLNVFPVCGYCKLCTGYFEAQPDPAAAKAFAEKMHPLGRLGEPLDHANAFVYLASEEAAWVTGTALVVDGGITCGVWGG